ncbi:unnamed protein product [Parnassius apollo]|uniref:(apollo) hypothetical protein n=1 Tax=Parnassius apollo TaxID=110799 RepID=A0A8S3W5R3_PARAO|nr:unnamed protein product [Parnassius apollo]
MTQSHQRRTNGGEPIPTPLLQINSHVMPELSTSFPNTSDLDDHVDAIAKNADDLGDWLYNQFYKTIESQVINNTNGNTLTRRSGTVSLKENVKKKRRKNQNKGTLKKSEKKEDLRRKLLRITEDDSLFDSGTDTDSSDPSSSDETHESRDQEHGHKKFVIINKKPKAPLPSFIFLPNLETPFYPPPALPMYPMVPVPPVLPSFPFPKISPDCNETETTKNIIITSSSTTLTSQATVPVQTVTTEPSKKTTSTPESITETTKSVSMESTTVPESEDKLLRFKKKKKKHMRSGGSDVLRRLQELVRNSTFKKKEQKAESPNVLDRETVETSDMFPDEALKGEDFQLRTNDETPLKQENTVDFKYLSQLIHRINLNETENPLEPMSNPNIRNRLLADFYKKNGITNVPNKPFQPSRRMNIQMYPQRQKTLDNSFYAKLGRQIATLIRGVNSKNDRQINIEIEQMDQNTPSHPIFSELSYAPHSYWERFVRSPMHYLQQYQNKKEYHERSNEILYNIENKVEIAASTMLPMSLSEIENVINIMEGAQDEIQKSYEIPHNTPTNNTLDINLWPQELVTNNTRTNSAEPFIKKIQKYFNYTKKYTAEKKVHSNTSGVLLQNIHNFTTWLGTEQVNNIPSNKIHNSKLSSKSRDENKKKCLTKNDVPISNVKQLNNPPNDFVQRRKYKTAPIRSTSVQHQALSPIFDYKKKRFLNINSQYPLYNLLEYQFPTVPKPIKKPPSRTVRPS